MDPFEDKMNKALQKLAKEIIPNNELLTEANKCADKIIKLFQTKSHFDVGRVVIAGSTGKKTTIISSDVDCVLFVNDELPQFKDVLEDWENILNMTDSYNLRDVRLTKYSIQFKALNFEFDILPAVNFTVGIQADRDTLINIQQQRVLAQIKKDPKKYGYSYSSSLADASVRFMERQSGFVHEMVRIAKFWYKTLHFIDYVSGAKSCIELIAVDAANKEENGFQTRSYLRSFERFIKYLQDFDQLNIHFEKNEQQVLDKSRPRVIDPVNPYNNLANNWDRKSIELVKHYANETKRRLSFFAIYCLDHLDQLFTPQPVYRPDMGEIFEYNPTKSQWLVGKTSSVSLFPDLKVRNESFGKDYKLRKGLEIIKLYFQIAICTGRASNFNDDKIKEIIKTTISKQVYNKAEFKWSSAETETHEDYDVTLTIPMSNQKSIEISYRL